MMADIRSGDADRMTLWQAIIACSGTAADRRNQYRFLAWMVVWGITYVGATWTLETNEALSGVVAWLLALAPNIFSIGALIAYMRFLRQADELIRRIQLEGLAIGFGAGVVFSIAYHLIERAGAPPLAVNTTVFVMMMGWIAGQLIATWNYR